MTAVKTAKTYTLEELKEKAGLALNVPALVEIAKTAPLEDGKINLTQVRDKAYQHVVEQTHDLKDAKKLADSTRFLAMLRRQFTEEFEKLILIENKISDPPRKLLHEITFSLPSQAVLISERSPNHSNRVDYMKFDSDDLSRYAAQRFCLKILSALIETPKLLVSEPYPDRSVVNGLIQLLEEKLGWKVKVCGDCKYYVPDNRQYVYSAPDGQCFYRVPDGYPGKKINFSDTCERDWTPKKIPEKPSSV